MKIILAQLAPYLAFTGGSMVANRGLLEGLASRHECTALTVGHPRGSEDHGAFLDRLAASGVAVTTSRSADVFRWNGVEVHSLADRATFARSLQELYDERDPTWMIASGERYLTVLRAALDACAARTILLVHTTASMPFGPNSYEIDAARSALVRQAAGVVAVSDDTRGYVEQWGGVPAKRVYLPSYGRPPYPQLGRFDAGRVTMINPCGLKGIAIFLALAERLPSIEFMAVPTWGTTDEDRAAMARLPNVTLRAPTRDLDELFAGVRVLLVPSLYRESLGQVVIDAMLRGVPVMASRHGGLPEVKLGVDYCLPVRPIESYDTSRTLPIPVQGIPTPRVPEQDVGPWLAALERLTTERAHYEEVSAASRAAAHAFVAQGAAPFEAFLAELAAGRPGG